VLQRAHAFMARQATLIVTLLLIYVAVASLLQAMNRAFWFDEVFTVVISRLGSMSDVWNALASAGDTSPPGFYVIQRFFSHLVSNELVGFRLGSIIAVPLTSLCIFVFVRRDTDPVAACIAAVLPLLTVLYSTFSVEARAYAPMACTLAFSALAWQRADARFGAVVLALALIASVSIHYYAVFALVPFAAAELTWSVYNRRTRPAVWLAFVAGGLACVAYWPLLNNLRQVYGRHYWAKASVFRAITSYDEYLSSMTLGATLGFVAVLSGALLVYVIRTVRPRPHDPIPPDVPPPNCVLALGLLWLPWIALVAAQVAGGGVAARYTIGAALGLAISAGYVLYWLGQRASAVLLMCLLTAFGCKEAVFWGAELAGRNTRRVDITGFHRLVDRGNPSEPIVVTNGMDFVPLAYYAPPATTKRLVALLDAESARQHTGTDSIELDLLVLQKYMAINVETYEAFELKHDRFLLYASPGHGEWWQSRLLRDGLVLTTLASDGSRVLYQVERKN
jgi:dolichyl-phosphate-mannose-protein mannosyltransferase